MLFHLFVFSSHMNCSIHSYSGCKLTVRMKHVHIVIPYHSQLTMQALVRKFVTCCQSRSILSPFLLYHPPLLFPSNVPPSSVSCLTFYNLTVSRGYSTTHISRPVSMLIHNQCVILSVMRLHNNVVSLVCLLFPHELLHSLLLSM